MSKSNIIIIDAIMGAGKTTNLIAHMEKNQAEERYIYITPYLSELERVQNKLPFIKTPRAVNGKKLEHFKNLILAGESVCTTHALLSRFDLPTQDAIEIGSYNLILDEVADVVHPFTFGSESDKKTFFEDLGGIDDEGYLYWDKEKNPVEEYTGRYYDIMVLCENKNLVQISNNLYCWELPIAIFNKFEKVYILTYLFNGSYQKSYFDSFGVSYEYMSISNGNLVPYVETSQEEKALWAELITIVDNDKLNKIGEPSYSLSSTWYKKNIKQSGAKTVYQKVLVQHLENYFKNVIKGKSAVNMWSTFKPYQSRLRGSGFTKGFVSFNARATNDFIEKENLAFLLNIYPHTSMTLYFNQNNLVIDNDEFALAILLQWIWRSRIRKFDALNEDRKINLYIPSLRMRNLLQSWLGIDQK